MCATLLRPALATWPHLQPDTRLLPIAAENGTRNARYQEAFGVVQAIGRLRAKLGEQVMFASELDEIRAMYRAKRNFIKLLEVLH